MLKYFGCSNWKLWTQVLTFFSHWLFLFWASTYHKQKSKNINKLLTIGFIAWEFGWTSLKDKAINWLWDYVILPLVGVFWKRHKMCVHLRKINRLALEIWNKTLCLLFFDQWHALASISRKFITNRNKVNIQCQCFFSSSAFFFVRKNTEIKYQISGD